MSDRKYYLLICVIAAGLHDVTGNWPWLMLFALSFAFYFFEIPFKDWRRDS